jgi:hypothetical protein
MKTLLLALVAAPLSAQVVHTKPAASGGAAAGGANIAAIAPAPQPVYGVQSNNFYVPPGMALYGNLPVVVLPDGRVFADFGRGYEQVIRSCASVVNTYGVVQPSPVAQPTVVQPTISQPTIAQPMPYTPPVPNQQTASQQMLPQEANAQVLASQSALVNSQACWTGNGRGLVYVAR